MEEHLRQLQSEELPLPSKDGNYNDTDWDGWEVESDSSKSSASEEGWIDVESADELDIILSDDEGDDVNGKAESLEKPSDHDDRPAMAASTLATTKVIFNCGGPCYCPVLTRHYARFLLLRISLF